MKKFWIQVTVLAAVILGAMYLSYNQNVYEGLLPINSQMTTQKLKIQEVILDIEVADTPAKRSQGLGGRESLASGSGMLFIFESPQKYQFWMKGMKFPLDMIFISQGKVVDVYRNAQPVMVGTSDQNLPRIQPVVPIDMMLEVNAGFTDQHNIRLGDQVFLVAQ